MNLEQFLYSLFDVQFKDNYGYIKPSLQEIAYLGDLMALLPNGTFDIETV